MSLNARPGTHAALLVLVLLAGCAGNPEPAPLAAPPTSPATATPEKVVVAPTLPPAARGTSRAAAVPFVRHWIETLNYAAETLDANALRDLSAENCVECGTLIKMIEGVRREGGYISGTEWSLVEPRILASSTNRGVEVQALVTMAPQTVKETSASKPKKFRGGQAVYTFVMVLGDGRLEMMSLDRAET